MFQKLLGLGIPVAIIAVVALSVLIVVALRRVVATNEVHIVQSGKKTVSYGKNQPAGNVYYEIPFFVPLLGVLVSKFSVSNFKISLKDYAAYDRGRLPFLSDVVAFFQIADSDMAANRVSSFAELTQQLEEILKGAVRRVLGDHPLEEILGMRSELGNTFTAEVTEQLKEWGVRPVKTIEFMDMRDVADSSVIHDIMAKDKSRIARESREVVAENKRKAEIAEVDAAQQVNLRKQEADEKVGQRTAEQEKAVGIAKEQSRQEQLAEAKTTAERDMEVKQVQQVRQAEIDKSVAEVRANQDKTVAEVKAGQDKVVAVVAAEAVKEKTVLIAEGNLAQSIKDAEGIAARGKAQGDADTAINVATVAPQIAMVDKIGGNEKYQEYLVRIEQVNANKAIGIEQAKSLSAANMKIIVTAGDVQSGFDNIGGVLSARGGQNLASFVEGLMQTPTGEAIAAKVTGADTPTTKTKAAKPAN